MPRLTALRALAAASAATGLLLASTASAAVVEDETTFFLRQDGCGATAEPGRLSTESGAPDGDSADGCGTIGGVPLEEAFFQVEGEALSSDDYTTVDGVPLVLDAARDVEGVIAAQSWTGGVGGVGDVVVEVTLYGVHKRADGKPASKVLGSGTFTAAASPTSTRTDVPVVLDVDDALQGVEFTSLSLNLVVRGLNWNSSAQSLNGTSYLTVPSLVDDSAGTVVE